MHIIHLHTYIHTYIHIYIYIYIPGTEIPGNLNTNTQRPNPEERATIGLLANTERASQSERAPQNPTSVFHSSLPRPPKIPDSDIVSMVNYMQVLRS